MVINLVMVERGGSATTGTYTAEDQAFLHRPSSIFESRNGPRDRQGEITLDNISVGREQNHSWALGFD